MISSADALVGRLNALLLLKTAEGRAQDGAAPPSASTTSASSASIAQTSPRMDLISPAIFAADSLVGLPPPELLNGATATRSLMLTDGVRGSGADPASDRASAPPGPGRSAAAPLVLGGRIRSDLPPRLSAPQPSDNTSAADSNLSEVLRTRIEATPSALLWATQAGDRNGLILPDPAGSIASSILNAAMIPGWPRPVALDPWVLEESLATEVGLQHLDEAQLLELVAALGGDEVLEARMLAESDERDRRRKLLRAICVLVTVIGAFVTALRLEVEELLSYFSSIENGGAFGAGSGRLRLPLK